MAAYTIKTTREQQIGLDYSYNTYADKVLYPTKEMYLQSQIDHKVLNPMWEEQQASKLKDFDASFATIPSANQPAAQADIEATIIEHGGTIVTATPPPVTPPVPIV